MDLGDLQPNDIAPCGVNCFVCSARFNRQTPCPGCRAPKEAITRKSCTNCFIKKCAFDQGFQWCFECPRFPCAKIKDLNKRYKNNYNVDLVKNGQDAKKDMDAFLEAQRKRFTCIYCGGIIDQHNRRCSICASEGL